jgi:hypothetical protein
MRYWIAILTVLLVGPMDLRAESSIPDEIPGLRPDSRQLLEKILAEHEKATGERIQIRRSETETGIPEPDQNEAAGAWTLWIHPKKQTLHIRSDISGASVLSDDSMRQITRELYSSTLHARGMDAAIRLSVQGLLERLRSPLAVSGRLEALALVQPGEAPNTRMEPLQIPLPLSLAALFLAWVTLFFLGRILFSTEIQVSLEGAHAIPPLGLFIQEMRAVAKEKKLGDSAILGGVDGHA